MFYIHGGIVELLAVGVGGRVGDTWIGTHVPVEKKTIPIWLASFLVFKLGLVGGEYITSSHGISVKNATKDLNSQGGQYLPEESMEFVNKIREIFEQTEKKGYYDIRALKNNVDLAII